MKKKLLALLVVLGIMAAQLFTTASAEAAADKPVIYRFTLGRVPHAGDDATHAYIKEVDGLHSASSSQWIPTAEDAEIAKAVWAGDYSLDYEVYKGKFRAGETYYAVSFIKFEDGDTADVRRVSLIETDTFRQYGDAVVNAEENWVVIAYSVTIPDITVTVDFGSDHADYAAQVAACSENVVMTASGGKITYKAEKGRDRWYDTLDPIRDAMNDVGVIDDNGERIYGGRGFGLNMKPIGDYADAEAWDADIRDEIYDHGEDNKDVTFYAQWAKPAGAELTIESPLCGTEVKMDPETREQVPAPEVTVTDGNAKVYEEMLYWVTTSSDGPGQPFEGTFEAGETYNAMIGVGPEFGYYLDGTKVTVKNGEIVQDHLDMGGMMIISVKAEHDPDDPVNGNEVPPTCTEAGSHDEIVFCKGCGEQLSTETVTDDAPGHDWGDWKTVKEATAEEEGEEERECSRCGEKETRTTSKLDPEEVTYSFTSGDGALWTSGSTDTLDFTVKRSVDDDKTFDLFTGILVDGEAVDASNYTAEAGSVNISLKAEYLETLAEGDHTITAGFDEGFSAEASFTILKEEGADDAAPEESKSQPESGKKGNGNMVPATGDNTPVMAWILIMCTAAALCAGMLFIKKKHS